MSSFRERRSGSSLAIELAFAVAAAALLAPLPVRAMSATQDLILEVEGDSGCVPRDELAARVQLRTQRLRLVPAGRDVPAARVRVSNASSGVSVELRVTRPGGRHSLRTLRAPNCSDALEATALVIAITFDPGASLDSPSSERSVDTSQTNPADTNSSSASVPRDLAAERARSQAERQHAEERAESARSATRTPWIAEWAIGAFGNRLQGVAPRALFGVGAFGTLAFRHGSFSPALHVRAAQHFSVSLTETDGTATFSAQSAALDLCPAGILLGPAALRACTYLGLTLLHARGSDTFSPRSVTEPEFALGGELLAALALAPEFGLLAAGGAAANLHRDRFAFSPSVFYRLPSVSWQGALGLEIRFP